MSHPAPNHIPCLVGQPAPDFTATALHNYEFKEMSLAELHKDKYLVLFFYPLDFTFVCPTEIIAFSDRADEFAEIGCNVAACSVDSHFSHFAWVNTPRKKGGLGDMKIPIISDLTKKIASSFGCLKEDEGVAFRAVYIISPEGIVRQATINDLPVGRSVDEVLRLVNAFKFTDEHGEVCPAGWKKGDKSMKADPKGSQEYFGEVNK